MREKSLIDAMGAEISFVIQYRAREKILLHTLANGLHAY
jgi:hypothetical protein